MGFLSKNALSNARQAKCTSAPTAIGQEALNKLGSNPTLTLPTTTPFDNELFNIKVAKIFEAIALYLTQQGEDRFRIGAYERAAKTIREQNEELSTWTEKELQVLPGIGKSSAAKIYEIATTGICKKYAELYVNSPPLSVAELEKLPGIGPVNAVQIWKEYGVDSLATLGEAITKGKITDQKLIDGHAFVSKELERVPLGMILPFVREFINLLMKKSKAGDIGLIEQISVAGSIRRGCETVRDVDILICTAERCVAGIQEMIITEFSQHGAEAAGENKCRLLYTENLLKVQIDILFTPSGTWGSKLMYFTGSKEFNIAVRRRAKAMGWTLNEYGLGIPGETIRFASDAEDNIFDHLDIEYIPPWLREIKAADLIDAETRNGAFRQRPTRIKNYNEDAIIKEQQLIPVATVADTQSLLYEVLGGSLHNHCLFQTIDGKQWDDGKITISSLVQECVERGMKYIGISSHSKSLSIARGLSEDALKQQIALIRENTWPLPVYAGSEMEIKIDGSLDWPESILDELDFVIAALHAQPGENVTKRIITAMQHPKICAIAHPTGRVFAERPIAEADWDLIFRAAIDTNTALEFNVQPSRADLPEELLKQAIQAGVKILISCDVHRLIDFDHIVLAPLMFNRAEGDIGDIFNFNEWRSK